MTFDCQACGACCAYSADWPRVETDTDLGPSGPPPELVTEGAMRTVGDRCVALSGDIGGCVGCTIYARRPTVCRTCEAGSQSCIIARRHFGLAVPPTTSGLDELIPG